MKYEHVEKSKYKSAPEATVKRLPSYWRLLKKFRQNGWAVVSCTNIADELNLNSIQVRKDLAFTEITGKPKVGYEISELIEAIENFLGWNNQSDAVVVGVGNLGKALMQYSGFSNYGLNIVAGFDKNPELTGKIINGKNIFSLSQLPDLIKRMRINIGILTVPEENAQQVSELLVASGIRAIWNFAPVNLILPPEIIVENVLFSSSFAVLSSQLVNALKEGK